jgi:hypothetical protein
MQKGLNRNRKKKSSHYELQKLIQQGPKKNIKAQTYRIIS